MPVMGGIESTKCIREFNTEIPIVALTANVVGDISEKCLEAGMDNFITKPLKKTILNKYLSAIPTDQKI